jgi:diguanylate cyclase (GGDEF)-like protein/PAS domain S-box-containing protein
MLACFDAASKRCVFANQRYAQLGGLTVDQAVGKTFTEIIGTEAAARIQPMVDRVQREKIAVTYKRSMLTPNGVERWIEVSLIPSSSPELDRTFVMITDISETRRSGERLRRFMAASVEGIAFHVGGVITDVNPPLLQMLGYTVDEMVGRSTLEFVPPEAQDRVRQVLQSGAELAYESFAQHKDGRALPVEYSVRDFDWEGRKQRLVVVRDLSERREAEARIRFLALHDSLTGLPNREQLDDQLNFLIAHSRELNASFALFFIDLDQLKRVNDSLGHSAGDLLLSGVATRLSSFCESQTTRHGTPWLARLGGDEFVIVLPRADRAASHAFSALLQTTFQLPVDIDGRMIRVTASVGVASFPDDGETPSQLLKNADAAMYLAKSVGRDTTRFFDQSLAFKADRALIIEGELDHALRHDEFELYLQPEVSPDGKRILGAEALIRWRHPTRGLLGPDEFIPIAEGLHLILPIGQWVLDTALAQIPIWREAGWTDARVSVNLSSNQFRAPGFTDAVLRSLSALGLNGDCLQLEVTERMLMSENPAVAESLNTLRNAQVTLAIDDFGTGFSSLSRLRKLPIEKLKIDRSFVVELPGTHSATAIVKSILELAQGLSLSAVAEGVETEDQRSCLESLGCGAMQGFLFARPMPAADFCAWLRALIRGDSEGCSERKLVRSP